MHHEGVIRRKLRGQLACELMSGSAKAEPPFPPKEPAVLCGRQTHTVMSTVSFPLIPKYVSEPWEHRGAVRGAEVGPGQICRGHWSWPDRVSGSWGDKEGEGYLWQQSQQGKYRGP